MPKTRRPPKAGPREPAPRGNVETAVKAKTVPPTMRKAVSQAGGAATPQSAARPTPRMIFDILHPGATMASDPGFRDAPEGWMPAQARALAAQAGLTLNEDHWEVIRVLQGCYKDEVLPRIRLLRDALEARFASKGGMKYLFVILPGGPIAQGCALAGLKPPHGARDLSFGSVA